MPGCVRERLASERVADRAAEREQQASERAAHATERAELIAQIERMRPKAVRHAVAEDAVAMHARDGARVCPGARCDPRS